MVKKVNYWLYAFICIHIAAWTLAPALVRFTLPMDAMEGTTWGHYLDWGYDKNPFMNAWLTSLAIKIGGSSGWMTYLFSQISVAACFFCVWLLGKKMMPAIYALIGVMLLEGVQYYNFHAIDFNDNTIELGLWALTTLFFYKAIREKTTLNWILTGFFAGLSMMTKYYIVVLLIPMLLFLLFNAEARESFKKSGLYLGILVFLLVITPHFIWLFSHQFVTVNYAYDRVSTPLKWWSRFSIPVVFFWQIVEAFIPAGVLLSVLIFGRFFKDLTLAEQSKVIAPKNDFTGVNTFDKTFLIMIGLGPFLITIIIAAICGMKLRAGWGQPLLSLWGLLLIACVQPTITSKQLYRFIAVTFFALALAIAGYSTALIRAEKPSSANFPGKEIATALTNTWHEKFHTPVPYVAGLRWLSGNIAFYSNDKPYVYIDWNKTVSPWIDEEKLKHTGAIFVWDLSERDNVPLRDIKKRFPKIGKPHVMNFAWLRNKNMPPVKIIVAYLPPSSSIVKKS